MHCQELHLTNWKVIFSIFRFSNSCFSAKYCSNLTNLHQWKAFLFSFFISDISISKNWPLWLVLWSSVTNKFSRFYFHIASFPEGLVVVIIQADVWHTQLVELSFRWPLLLTITCIYFCSHFGLGDGN